MPCNIWGLGQGFSCNISWSTCGFNKDLWAPCAVLHFKHSAVINRVVSRTPLWKSQRGVVTQDRSPTIAPDLCQRKMVTGIALGLSHVHYCLYLKRPQGDSDAFWRSNRERQWETDLSWVEGGVEVEKEGGDYGESVWENLISDTFLWLQYNTTYIW